MPGRRPVGSVLASNRTPKLNSEVGGERTRLGCGFLRPRGKHRSRLNFRSIYVHHTSKRLDARRVQQHPWRVCSQTSEFEFNSLLKKHPLTLVAGYRRRFFYGLLSRKNKFPACGLMVTLKVAPLVVTGNPTGVQFAVLRSEFCCKTKVVAEDGQETVTVGS